MANICEVTTMKVYTDTSVFGGCFDNEFKEWSSILLDEFMKGEKKLILSDLTIQEVELARLEVRNKLQQIPKKNSIIVGIGDESIFLAETYIKEGALTNKSYNDALHIALATIHDADILASWNFKHIVNVNRIRLYNSINLRLGYKMLDIRSPREIINH